MYTNNTNKLESFINLVNKHYKLILIIILIVTGFFAVYAAKLKTNATPYFLDSTHPSRVADKKLKQTFSGSGEVVIITTKTNKNSIFNKQTLQDLYDLTVNIESLTLTTEDDFNTFKKLLQNNKIDDAYKKPFANAIKFKPKDYVYIKKIYENLAKDMLTTKEKSFLKDLLIKVWPVKKVRSLVRIESISADSNESFDVHSLMSIVPKTDKEIDKLEHEAYNNHLLKDLLFKQENKKIVNSLVELRIPQDDAPKMKQMYDLIKFLPKKLKLQDTYYISGPPAIFAETAAVVKATSDKMFPFVILVILIILYLLYRNILTMFLPVLVATLSVIWTLGTMSYFGYQQNIVSTIIPVFLISIGVSDSIHILSEYHKSHIQNKISNIKYVLKKIFKPILFTTITTMVGFLALAYTPIRFIQEFGLFVAIGIFYAFLLTLLFLPSSLLLLAGKEKKKKNNTFNLLSEKLVEKLVILLQTKPKKIIFGIALILLISIVGITKLQIDNEMIEYFSHDSKVYKDTKFINKYSSGASTIEFTLASSKVGFFKEKDNVKKLQQIISRIRKLDRVSAVYALPDFIKLMNQGLNGDDKNYFKLPEKNNAYAQYLFLYDSSSGKEIYNVVNTSYTKTRIIVFVTTDKTSVMENIQKNTLNFIQQELPLVKSTPSGFGEVLIATKKGVIFGQITSLMISVSIIFILLWILFKSLKLAFIGLVPLLITILFNFGLMGWMGLYLDVGTAIVAPIAIGIGVDNAIYYISYYQNTIEGENRSLQTIPYIFNALFANSLVLGGGFLVLLFAEHQSLVNLGWLVALTVIVSTVATLVILPLIFQILENKNEEKDSK